VRVILTVGRNRRWRADVIDLGLRRDHVQKFLSFRSKSRTRRPTLVCITGSGILRIACEGEEERNGQL
jgi:hypothetical protein